MSELALAIRPFFLVAIGAITGSWIRMYAIDFFESSLPFKHWGTMTVNIFSSFLLGLFLAWLPNSELNSLPKVSSLFMFISVGFLGSLSTFSTFVSDLLSTLLVNNWRQFFSLAVLSLVGGLLAVWAGFILGDG